VSKTGLADPCPCGSGKAYRDCCFAKEPGAGRSAQESMSMSSYAERYNAATSALGWLLEDERRRNGILDCFYRGEEDLYDSAWDSKDDANCLMHSALLAEWAIAEAPDLAGGAKHAGFARLVLRKCPVAFSREGLAWIRALEGSAMSLYEVRQTEPGRMLVQELVHGGTGPEWIETYSGVNVAVQWDVVGLRLVPGREFRRMGTGLLDFERSAGLRLVSQVKKWLVRNARHKDPEDPVRMAGLLCLQAWLYQTFGPNEEAPLPRLVVGGSNEEVCFVKDWFRVADWDALKDALASREDVRFDDRKAGSGEAPRWSWTWLERGAMEGGMDRVLATFFRKPDGLLVECMAKGRADAARAMLEACAGGLAKHASRSVESIQDALARRMQEGPSPEVKSNRLPPDVESEVLRQVSERYYRQWMDMSVPALDGRTPRHAARLKTQKAKVVELLKDIENSENARARNEGRQPVDFGFLWKELGLER